MQVKVEDVGFSYRHRQILVGFSATFEDKAMTALVGPSGSGKSTLLAAIAGYTRPHSGRIGFIDPEGGRRDASVDDVSWIAQDANVLGARTALDNVMIGTLGDSCSFTEASDRCLKALGDVGLDHLARERCRTLSGGEKQRVVIARSLASNRPLVIADEPSAGLDEATTRSLARLLATVHSRATIIVATHDPVMMAAATAVVCLRSTP